eukprot:scaffold44988_cov67-Phaeocystis_antarctica.AAC.2
MRTGNALPASPRAVDGMASSSCAQQACSGGRVAVALEVGGVHLAHLSDDLVRVRHRLSLEVLGVLRKVVLWRHRSDILCRYTGLSLPLGPIPLEVFEPADEAQVRPAPAQMVGHRAAVARLPLDGKPPLDQVVEVSKEAGLAVSQSSVDAAVSWSHVGSLRPNEVVLHFSIPARRSNAVDAIDLGVSSERAANRVTHECEGEHVRRQDCHGLCQLRYRAEVLVHVVLDAHGASLCGLNVRDLRMLAPEYLPGGVCASPRRPIGFALLPCPRKRLAAAGHLRHQPSVL